jgi:transposase
MPAKIPKETIELMQRLYNNDERLSTAEIAKRANVSFCTAYIYTLARKRGFASGKQYREHLARKKGFASLNEQVKHRLKKKGFASRRQYERHLLGKRGFASLGEYVQYLAKERGFASLNHYYRYLLEERGFASQHQYKKYLKLRKFYREVLSGLAKDLRFVGYNIESLTNDKDNLVVKLLKEDIGHDDKEFIETNFRYCLQECSQLVNANNGFEVFCDGSTVFIKPNNLESRAFLYAYELVLGREIVK